MSRKRLLSITQAFSHFLEEVTRLGQVKVTVKREIVNDTVVSLSVRQ